jgi:TPR repeat protein
VTALGDRLVALASPAAALRRALRHHAGGRMAPAFALYTRAARAGIAEAEYRLALAYLEGKGVPPSRAEAVHWLELAATHGEIDAQTLFATLCVHGLAGAGGSAHARLFAADEAGEPDFATAAKWARAAAEAGSAKGQALYAYVLSAGPAPLLDPEAAHLWYERSAAAHCPEGCLGYALSLAPRADDEDGRRRVAANLRLAAEAGLPTAIYLLAALTEAGIGVARDPSVAVQLYRHAAERGHRAAQLRWGLALLDGREVEADPAAGETWLRRAALGGEAEAAALLGDLYARSGPLPPNYGEAANWYRRAAEAGHGAAARALGSLYLTGAGVGRDAAEAAHWLRLGGRAGDHAAQIDFANLVRDGAGEAEDPARVAQWFATEAETGDLVGAFNFAVCLDQGFGVLPDARQAADWLRRAAEGVPEAQYLYGRILAEGRGVAADPAAARRWIGEAADRGLAEARLALAEMLVNGRGGPPDPAAALRLFEEAAAEGHSGAMFALGALHAGGHCLAADRAAAQRWFRAAAERGHAQAQQMLGRYLAAGVVDVADPTAARVWLEKAVAQGNAEAAEDLAALPPVIP